ncbi:MAG: metallophosphoesterase [Geminicoccaceae bacterium]
MDLYEPRRGRRDSNPVSSEQETIARLERRLGRTHARQRLGIESDHEARILGRRLNLTQVERWYSIHGAIRTALRLAGLHGRAVANAGRVMLRHNTVQSRRLPAAFDGYRVLHLSDLHADMSGPAMDRLVEMLPDIDYDLCVMTGDYRGKTFGPWEASLAGVEKVCRALKGPVYGVLGNHDTIRMVPALEDMGLRLLLNEAVTIEREGSVLHLAGIDDAHFYRVHNIEKAAAGVSPGDYLILLSHTPEVYRQAAHAGVDLMLSGHTHGGQICLPGDVPITLDSDLPRSLGRGAWRHGGMQGYTSVGAGSSVVAVRLNCAPEITLHTLQRA